MTARLKRAARADRSESAVDKQPAGSGSDAFMRARQAIAGLSALPILDARLLKIVAEPEAGSQYDGLQTLLHADPTLAARVLKVANSAFFGGPRTIDSIKRALDVLGTAAVIGIALAASLDGTVSQLGTTHLGFFDQLRQHSLITAVAARHLALRRPTETWTPEAAFVLGLLHDLGWLVQLQLASDSQVAVVGAPTALDGLVRPPPPESGHALFGAALLSHWSLPGQFANTVLHHHDPLDEHATCGHRLLAIADRCAHFHADRLPEGDLVEPADLPLQEFQLTPDALPQFSAQMAGEALVIGALVRK